MNVIQNASFKLFRGTLGERALGGGHSWRKGTLGERALGGGTREGGTLGGALRGGGGVLRGIKSHLGRLYLFHTAGNCRLSSEKSALYRSNRCAIHSDKSSYLYFV